MADKEYRPYDPDVTMMTDAERRFISMARSPEFSLYVGRFSEATVNELVSIFGVAMAAARSGEGGTPRVEHLRPSPAAPADARALEARLEHMDALLKRREEQIRRLQNQLNATKKRGSQR